MKDHIYLNCRERYEDMIDQCSYTHHLSRIWPEFFSGLNLSTALVVCITALINMPCNLVLLLFSSSTSHELY